LFVDIIKVKKGNNSVKKLCNQIDVIIYKSQYGKKLACKLFSGISSSFKDEIPKNCHACFLLCGDSHIVMEILLKVVLNTLTLTILLWQFDQTILHFIGFCRIQSFLNEHLKVDKGNNFSKNGPIKLP
jgi:hypothetical protein